LRARGLFLLAALLPATGCLTTHSQPLRPDLDALRAQVAEIQKANADLKEQLAKLSKSGGSPAASATGFAAADARIASLEGGLAALRQQLDDTLDRVNTLSQDVQATRELALRAQPPRTAPSQPPEGDGEGSGAPSEASPTGEEGVRISPPALEDSYNAAYADFTKGNYTLAIAGFEDFLKRYPQSELADNAQYWIGESYFSQGDFESAAVQYDRVIQKYPKGDKVPGALLKKGLSYLELNRTAEGVVLLQHVIETYPGSEEAALARDRIQGMGLRP